MAAVLASALAACGTEQVRYPECLTEAQAPLDGASAKALGFVVHTAAADTNEWVDEFVRCQRRKDYARRPDVSPAVKSAVLGKQLAKGMPMDAVMLVYGSPYRSIRTSSDTEWQYGYIDRRWHTFRPTTTVYFRDGVVRDWRIVSY
jgi:hypothetical protein